MKVIKIDSLKEEISIIDINGSLESIYKELNCTIVEAPIILDNEDTLYDDEEGLFVSESKGGFMFSIYHSPLMGNGLIIGSNDEGENVDVKSTLEDIINKVKFLPGDTCEYILKRFQA